MAQATKTKFEPNLKTGELQIERVFNASIYTDHFSDKDGNFNNEMPSTTVTLRFEDLGDGRTKLTSHATYKPEELQKVLDMGMQQGLAETFDKLEEYLAKSAK
jgi:uncharacterized protein YndB with AHSA1/START domain